MPKNPAKKLSVFLCHAYEDKSKVRELYNRLILDGYEAWFDEQNILAGQDWKTEIQKALRNADVIIICLSVVSVKKEGFIQVEIKEAIEISKEKPEGVIFIVPLRFDDCTVPLFIQKWHWLNLYEENGYERLKRSLNAKSMDISSPIIVKEKKEQISVPISDKKSSKVETARPQQNSEGIRRIINAFQKIPKKIWRVGIAILSLITVVSICLCTLTPLISHLIYPATSTPTPRPSIKPTSTYPFLTPTQTITQTPTMTPTATITFTPSTTPSPTISPTITPTPLIAVFGGTPLPTLPTISAGNAHRLTQIARWGKTSISDILFSPDGLLLAISSPIGIYIYNSQSNELNKFLETEYPVTCIAFSQDGKYIAAGSSDKTIHLWRLSDGSLTHVFIGHSATVNSVAFSPNNETIASGSSDHTIRLWDIIEEKPIQTIIGHAKGVTSVAFSPDGKILVTGSFDKDIALWDLSNGKSLDKETTSDIVNKVILVAPQLNVVNLPIVEPAGAWPWKASRVVSAIPNKAGELGS